MNMEYALRWIGELSTKILGRFSNEKCAGRIIQPFKNTAYIKTHDDNLICLTSYGVRAPMYLNFKGDLDFSSLDYSDAEVIKIKDGLYIKGTTFNMSSGRYYLRKKQFDLKKGVYGRALFAAKTLSLFDLTGSILDSCSPFFINPSYLIKILSNFICTHNFVQIERHISSLIGLGNGFTPSGDDFLVGFLFCLNQLLLCRDLATTNFRITGNTNWISKKFIEYSQYGYVIEPLEKFVNSLFREKEESIISALTDLVRIGHSSGIDTSVGVLLATSLNMGKEFLEPLYNALSL
jgi:hypothetical protein